MGAFLIRMVNDGRNWQTSKDSSSFVWSDLTWEHSLKQKMRWGMVYHVHLRCVETIFISVKKWPHISLARDGLEAGITPAGLK